MTWKIKASKIGKWAVENCPGVARAIVVREDHRNHLSVSYRPSVLPYILFFLLRHNPYSFRIFSFFSSYSYSNFALYILLYHVPTPFIIIILLLAVHVFPLLCPLSFILLFYCVISFFSFFPDLLDPLIFLFAFLCLLFELRPLPFLSSFTMTYFLCYHFSSPPSSFSCPLFPLLFIF